jgi:hypothetical protein
LIVSHTLIKVNTSCLQHGTRGQLSSCRRTGASGAAISEGKLERAVT